LFSIAAIARCKDVQPAKILAQEETNDVTLTGKMDSTGTLVLMHGSLVHMSYENKSDQSRQAYTLHIIEGPPHATYPEDNWY